MLTTVVRQMPLQIDTRYRISPFIGVHKTDPVYDVYCITNGFVCKLKDALNLSSRTIGRNVLTAEENVGLLLFPLHYSESRCSFS